MDRAARARVSDSSDNSRKDSDVKRRSEECEGLAAIEFHCAHIMRERRKEVPDVPDESEVLVAMGISCAQVVTRGDIEGFRTNYESESIETMSVGCTQAFTRGEADHKTTYRDKVQSLQNNQVDGRDKPRQGISLEPPHLANVDVNDYLMTEDAWQTIPDFILYDEAAERIENAEVADPDPDADMPDHVKARKRGGRRHKGHFMKRPMAMSEVIEELQHPELRENALRCLSGHLNERREQDVEFYRQAGFYLYHSCGTVSVLLQEVVTVYDRLFARDLKVRGSKRLSNVLTLLQSIAANEETRVNFARAGLPNYLLPFIVSPCTEEVYENVRAMSLSVIGVLCQSRDIRIIKWALDSGMIQVCLYSLEVGGELSKVLAMTILESILRKNEGLYALCEANSDLLPKLAKICGDLISILATVQGFSPRLVVLIVRCLIVLCQNRRAVDVLKNNFPKHLEDGSFNDLRRDYPIFNYLHHQLLLCIGKASDSSPSDTSSRMSNPASPSIEGTEMHSSSVTNVPQSDINIIPPIESN